MPRRALSSFLPAYAAAVRHLGPRRAWLNLVHRARGRGRSFRRYSRPRWGDLELVGRARYPFPAATAGVGATLVDSTFSALRRCHDLGRPLDWDYPETDLWRFHLHYFGYLTSLPDPDRGRLVLDWIHRYRPRRGRPGWLPYPLSLRLRSWAKLLFAPPAWSGSERAAVLGSIEAQGCCLADTVEYHLCGNHLLENGITLKLLAACFRGRAVARWARIGDSILRAELDEQFLPDGGHIERSPMYHALLTGGLLDLVNVLPDGDPIRELVESRLPGALAFLLALTHSDGQIALFNDAALDTTPDPRALLEYASLLGWPLPGRGPAAFPDTGYGVWASGGDAFLIDCGPVGPDYVPAHAHADIFSFEMSLGGRRLVVDGGTSTYLAGEERDWVRSTRAHNTVEVAGTDQCELLGAFRLGRRGRPRDVWLRVSPEGLELQGWHDGYRRLPGRPVHRREVRFVAPSAVFVWDAVESEAPHPAVSRIHLAPGVTLQQRDSRTVTIELPGLRLLLVASGGRVDRESGYYAPRFGERLPIDVLAVTAERRASFGYVLAPEELAPSIDADGGALRDRRIPRRESPEAGRGATAR